MRLGAALLVWFAVVFAVALAVLGAWVANQYGADTNLWTTGITALVVAGFLAIFVFKPNREQGGEEEVPEDAGFKVLGGQVRPKAEEKRESSVEKLEKD